MKKALTIVVLMLLGVATQAQNNVFKVQPIPLAVKKFDVTYERAISKRTSLAFAGSMMLDNDFSLGTISDNAVSVGGWSVWPQYRIYPGIKEAPKGFYLAPYLSYSRFEVAYTDSFDLASNAQNIEAAAQGTLSSFSVGGLLGIQWVFDNHFTIDWHFLGIGYSLHNLAVEIEPEDAGVSIAELAEEVENATADWPVFGNKIDVSSTAEKVKVNAPFSQIGLRSGISIGFAF